MRLVQRVTAAISSILLLQLSIMGPGGRCAAHRSNDAHHGHDAAAAIARPDAAMPAMTHQASDVTASERSDVGTTDDSGRGRPGQGTCESMSACLVAAWEPTTRAAFLAPMTFALDLSERVQPATSLSIAPEPPPPRG
jgi:hypothetical protein